MPSDPSKLMLPDPDLVRRTLSSPPFHSVQGVINFRDVGLLSPDSTVHGDLEVPRIRQGVLFRSGELTRLTDKGKTTLKQLGITTIFDLRSEVEIRKYKSSTPEIEGVRFIHVPVSDKDEYDPMALAARVSKFASDEKNAFAALYSGILENGGPAYETILKHLRDKPDEPCLVHCTAGKDRTGIFAAIVQLLLGVPDAVIAHDYHLTTYGLAPVLPALTERFQKETIYRDNWDGFQKMGSAKKETMLATLDLIRSKYGSVEEYIKTRTSLTDEDISLIRLNLITPPVSASCSSFSDTSSTTLESQSGVTSSPESEAVRDWGPDETDGVGVGVGERYPSRSRSRSHTQCQDQDQVRDVVRSGGDLGLLTSGFFALFAYVGALFEWIWRVVL